MPPRPVPFKLRVAVYLGLWVFVAAAFARFMDAYTTEEMHFGELRRWVMMPVYTPVWAVFGFAMFLDATRNADGPLWQGILLIAVSAGCYAGLVVAMLRAGRLWVFLVCAGVQGAVFAVSVVYFIRMVRLADAGG